MKNKDKIEIVSEIYESKKKQIIHGELKKGEKLAELHLCDEYRCSRLHVKEALKMLEMEALVEYLPKRGYFVKGISFETLQEAAAIRYSLDGVLCRYFVEHGKAEDYIQLENVSRRIEAFSKSKMLEDVIAECRNFYAVIYEICPFMRIKKTLDNIQSFVEILQSCGQNVSDFHQVGNENIKRLFAALKTKDYDLIDAALYARDKVILDSIAGEELPQSLCENCVHFHACHIATK